MPRPELKDVVSLITEPLQKLGYQRRKIGFFTYEFNKDVLGVIDFIVTKKPYGLVTDPFIGLRHQSVHRLYCQLEGDKFHPYDPPTMSTDLGVALIGQPPYQADHLGSWIFEDEEDLAKRGPSMVEAFRDHGMPYIEKHTSLEAVTEYLAEGDVPGRFSVVALYLLKGLAAALEHAERYLDRFNPELAVGVDYRRFIRRLLEHAKSEGKQILLKSQHLQELEDN